MSLPSYQYVPLQNKDCFRLLRLRQPQTPSSIGQNKSGSTSLQGKLLDYKFGQSPDYGCLSYVWGTTKPSRALVIDDKALPITANLEQALVSVRKVTKTSFLWVDAVCINQSDDRERESQVQKMSTIFGAASHTVAYLGPEKDGSEHFPAIISNVSTAIDAVTSSKGINTDNVDENIILPARYEDLGLPKEIDPSWNFISMFFSRPWFRRAWIIQEAALAQNLTFLCGQWSLPAESIFHAVQILKLHFPGISGAARAARTSMKQIQLITGIKLQNKWTTGISNFQSSTLSLLEILHRSEHDPATDERDNIFAILGISRERDDEDLKPNYKESWQESYRRFAIHCIKNGQGARLFEVNRGSHIDKGVPSWVPDWTGGWASSKTLVPNNNLSHDEAEYYLEEGGPFSDMRVEPCGRQLVVKGYLIDVIQQIGVATLPKISLLDSLSSSSIKQKTRDDGAPDLIKEFLGCMEELKQMLSTSAIYINDEQREDVVWRVMMINRKFGSSDEASDDYQPLLTLFRALIKTKTEMDAEYVTPFPGKIDLIEALAIIKEVGGFENALYRVATLISFICSQCEGLRRCLGERGNICQVPESAKAGDSICIVGGVSIPLIIRPEKNGYTIVGQCYVHGLGKGETRFLLKSQLQDIRLF